ncbi:hypothetical protein Baya_15941 [Bagarius yarrelli]|uniref:Uncharacterized protein n=1 Tax=Bagarius yarrelli TaxID=175774 RepID=A0A556VTY8_BAGYA|nr:hypothetical protein Baya_15941 [Bagarius yarrelli]
MEHQDMMNSGQYDSKEDVASAMADVNLDDSPRVDMKNGTAAHMAPGDGLGKDALTPEGLSPPHSGRSSAASMDREEEGLNGDMAGSVSPQQSPMSPRASQVAPADATGSDVLIVDSQVKTSPSEEIAGFEDGREEEVVESHVKEDESKALSFDHEEELLERPAMPDSRSDVEDKQEEKEVM